MSDQNDGPEPEETPSTDGAGADELRDHPAAVDITDQNYRHIGGLGKAHIGDVAIAQVDLCRGARAFDEDDIRLCTKPLKAFHNARHQSWFQLCIIAGLGGRQALALHHHLRARLGFGFQQHRIHICVRLNPRCTGLQSLRAPDFTAIDRARFRRPVVPGERLEIRVMADKVKRGMWWYRCEATVDSQGVASATIICAPGGA